MAGKADLVNSIADSASFLQDIPTLDGWKHGAVSAAAEAPAGSLADPFAEATG